MKRKNFLEKENKFLSSVAPFTGMGYYIKYEYDGY